MYDFPVIGYKNYAQISMDAEPKTSVWSVRRRPQIRVCILINHTVLLHVSYLGLLIADQTLQTEICHQRTHQYFSMLQIRPQNKQIESQHKPSHSKEKTSFFRYRLLVCYNWILFHTVWNFTERFPILGYWLVEEMEQ